MVISTRRDPALPAPGSSRPATGRGTPIYWRSAAALAFSLVLVGMLAA